MSIARRSLLSLLLLVAVAACSKPEPPKITPRAARVTSIDAKGMRLLLELEAYNPNGFPLIARTVTGALEVGAGAELGRASSAPSESIPAKGSSVISAELDVSWTNAGALAPFALSDKPVPYTFRGVATIGGERINLDVPFTVTGELTRAQVLQIGLKGLAPPGLPIPALP
jgi:LEA14-like dessication related protein